MTTSFAETALSIEMLGSIAYYVAFGISFLESIAFIGLIIPSTGILIALGFLVSWGGLKGLTLLITVTIGGFLGDLISFYLGKHGLQWFKPGNKIFKLEYLKKGEVFFARHGAKSIFLARFISPLRPILPFVAGLFGMARSRFVTYAAIGSILSSTIYLGIGYGIGTLSENSNLYFSHVERVLIGFMLCAFLLVFARRFILQQGELVVQTIKTVTTTTLRRILSSHVVYKLLKHHRRLATWLKAETHRLGLFLVVCGISMLCLLIVTLPFIRQALEGSTAQSLDIFILSKVFSWRTPLNTQIIRFSTDLGSPIAIFVITIMCSIKFWHDGKKMASLIFLGTILCTVTSVALSKIIVNRERPPDFIAHYQENSLSFPSSHAATMLVLSFFLVHIVSKSSPWANRVYLYTAALSLTLYIGFTRIFLGVHYPTDVLAGFYVGLGWFLIGVGLESALRNGFSLDKSS